MFKVRRVRLALTEDGEVVAVLGVDVEVPGGTVLEMRQPEATEWGWARGIWLRLEGLPV